MCTFVDLQIGSLPWVLYRNNSDNNNNNNNNHNNKNFLKSQMREPRYEHSRVCWYEAFVTNLSRLSQIFHVYGLKMWVSKIKPLLPFRVRVYLLTVRELRLFLKNERLQHDGLHTMDFMSILWLSILWLGRFRHNGFQFPYVRPWNPFVKLERPGVTEIDILTLLLLRMKYVYSVPNFIWTFY